MRKRDRARRIGEERDRRNRGSSSRELVLRCWRARNRGVEAADDALSGSWFSSRLLFSSRGSFVRVEWTRVPSAECRSATPACLCACASTLCASRRRSSGSPTRRTLHSCRHTAPWPWSPQPARGPFRTSPERPRSQRWAPFESCRSCCVSRTRKSSSSRRFSAVAMPRYKSCEAISTSFSVCFPLNRPWHRRNPGPGSKGPREFPRSHRFKSLPRWQSSTRATGWCHMIPSSKCPQIKHDNPL